MRGSAGQPVRLADYRAPDFLIDAVDMDISLDRDATRVVAELTMRPKSEGRADAPLALDGDELTLVALELDGVALPAVAYTVSPDKLTIPQPPRGPFKLKIETRLAPAANRKLMGLYRSGSAYCTQCEAEGFRRITYFLDRPDVLSIYRVRLEADKAEAPVLLANGNLETQGDLGKRHFAVWRDPFKKPCYLFAVVAGDLDKLEDTFVTSSGRSVALGVYTEPGKAKRAAYAMDALKRSMAWDERVYGREYDLDVFNVVAVSDFNMGAMENKGLNVFNDKYVLASAETATDDDYAGIESVIAHEYFHNWTGNRITCRDWFQLCLKEGLTVFRDQDFTADERSAPVKRIVDVRGLKAAQFPEDAGPLAHNVRPEVYHEINNFYTATVYQKGAEVIRMLKTLIGASAFKQGMDLYFRRCDGTAATIEQFLACFAEASGRDLTIFKRWYAQAGTPHLKIATHHDAAAATFRLELSQSLAPTPGQSEKAPATIPVRLGLVDPEAGRPRADLAGRERARTRDRRVRAGGRESRHHLPQRRPPARALRAARLLRAGDGRGRPDGSRPDRAVEARQRSVQPLAGFADAGDAPPARGGRSDPRGAAAGRRPRLHRRLRRDGRRRGAGPDRPRLRRAGAAVAGRGRPCARAEARRRPARGPHRSRDAAAASLAARMAPTYAKSTGAWRTPGRSGPTPRAPGGARCVTAPYQ